MSASIVIVGTGIVGLSTAVHLAEKGVRVTIVGTSHAGEASTAAAGMLTPSVESELSEIADLSFRARNEYPNFVHLLKEKTGIEVPLRLDGAVRLALNEREADQLRSGYVGSSSSNHGSHQHTRSSQQNTHGSLQHTNHSSSSDLNSPVEAKAGVPLWLSPTELGELEPGINSAFGGLLFPQDGSVEVPRLMDALRAFVAAHPMITIVNEDVTGIEFLGAVAHADTNLGSRIAGDELVLAAGAWSPGLLAPDQSSIRIEPVRGQICEYQVINNNFGRVIYGGNGYLVPRSDGVIIAGSTSERVGFNSQTSEAGLDSIEKNARLIAPVLNKIERSGSWAGLRPVTPDWKPIIGKDPIITNLTYACGHSRNGILLGPVTGALVSEIIMQEKPTYDLYQFRPARF